MYVRSRAPSGISAEGDFLALADLLSRGNQHLAQMAVSGFSSVRMLDIHNITVAASQPALVTVPPEEAMTAVPTGVAQSIPLWLVEAPLVGAFRPPKPDDSRPPEMGLI